MANKPHLLPTVSWDLSKAMRLRLEKGLSYDDIAKALGISKSTLHQSLSKYEKLLDMASGGLPAYRDNKAELMESLEGKILRSIADPEKLEKASAYQLTGMFGIIHDKLRLERGQSTQNISYLDLTKSLSEAREMRKKLEQEASVRGWDIEEMSQTDNKDEQ